MTQWTRENSRAFMPYPDCDVPHAESGPLAGLTFSVKDMFDVAGFPTSAGSPTMLGRFRHQNQNCLCRATTS